MLNYQKWFLAVSTIIFYDLRNKKYFSGLFLDRNFKNSDFSVILQISIQELDRLMAKYQK